MPIYLACPYTHPDPTVCARREEIASRAAAFLLVDSVARTGKPVAVFSPITQGHRIADFLPLHLRQDSAFWVEQYLPVLAKCSELVILQLPGWTHSNGVRREWQFVVRNCPQTPIRYLRFEDDGFEFREDRSPHNDSEASDAA